MSTPPTKYRSEISAMVHPMMRNVHRAGMIDDATMLEFDRSCVVASGSDVTLSDAPEHEKV
jgi:DNA-binding transcriptional regulator YiaG